MIEDLSCVDMILVLKLADYGCYFLLIIMQIAMKSVKFIVIDYWLRTSPVLYQGVTCDSWLHIVDELFD